MSCLILSCVVPPNIHPASGLTSQIAVKDGDYVIEFSITEDFPSVQPDDIQWWYQEDATFIPRPWPPSLDFELEERHYLSSNKRLLSIDDVQIIDGGLYTLSAANEAGTRNQTISLTIHGKASYLTKIKCNNLKSFFFHFSVEPVLQDPFGTLLVREEDEMAVFNCSADGIPAPNIVWRRGGQLLVEAQSKFQISNTKSDAFRLEEDLYGLEGTYSVLTVLNLATTDSTTYSCRADNGAGSGVIMQEPYTLKVNGTYVCMELCSRKN